jgi:hypothetical protein
MTIYCQHIDICAALHECNDHLIIRYIYRIIEKAEQGLPKLEVNQIAYVGAAAYCGNVTCHYCLVQLAQSQHRHDVLATQIFKMK